MATVARVLFLPGMDGGTELSKPFRAGLHVDADALAYAHERFEGYDDLEGRVRTTLAEHAQPTALVAESFSGPLAIRIAADPPPNLRRLVLVATFSHAPAPTFLRPHIKPWLFRRAPPPFALRRLLLDGRAPTRRSWLASPMPSNASTPRCSRCDCVRSFASTYAMRWRHSAFRPSTCVPNTTVSYRTAWYRSTERRSVVREVHPRASPHLAAPSRRMRRARDWVPQVLARSSADVSGASSS